MRRVDLRTLLAGDQPESRQRMSGDAGRIGRHLLFPLCEVHGARERRQHDELRKRDVRLLRELGSGVERFELIGRQSENERTENMDAVLAKFLEPRDELVARVVEILEDRLQPFRR